jgi:hypothetical protein
VWRALQDFLEKRLHLSVEEFNSVSVAGIPTATRLEQMLDTATFAFLVMTAEDETSDGKLHARLNVVHEAGLFQGKLGFKKAIILLEDGCEDFSNIDGLGDIRFPKNNISAKFEDIRAVLEREELELSFTPKTVPVTSWLLASDSATIKTLVPGEMFQDWETKKQTEDDLTHQLQKLAVDYADIPPMNGRSGHHGGRVATELGVLQR